MNKTSLFKNTWWALIVLLTLATPLIGTIGASLVIILSIVCLPFIIDREAFLELRKLPMIVMFSIGLIVFAFFTAITAKSAYDRWIIFAFMPFLSSATAYILAKNYAKIHGGKKTAQIFLTLCLIGSGLTILVAIADMTFVGSVRPRGFFSGVITLSMVGTTLGIVAGMGFFLVEGYKKLFFMLGPIFALVIIALTQSRGTAIALPSLAALYFIYAIRRTKTFQAKVLVVLTLSILLALSYYFITQQSARIAGIFDIVNQVLDHGLSSIMGANIRIEMYLAGWELFLAEPFFGYGWTNMSEMAFTVLDASKYDAHLIRYFHFHNDFLNFAFAIGVVGIVIYFSFLFAPIIGALKSQKDKMFGFRLEIILLMTTLYFFSGLTGGTLSHGLLITLYAMISAIVLGGFQGEQLKDKSKT